MVEKAISNGNEPANGYAIPDGYWSHNPGLTKRELFAKDLLCSLISNADRHSQIGDCQSWNYEHLSQIALSATDALLLELEKTAQ